MSREIELITGARVVRLGNFMPWDEGMSERRGSERMRILVLCQLKPDAPHL